jgi:hypothetical protein
MSGTTPAPAGLDRQLITLGTVVVLGAIMPILDATVVNVTDRAGAVVVVPAGVVLGLAGLAAYTQVGAATPYAVLATALFVIGLGLGATFIPLMAAAYQGLPPAAIPSVTGTLNTVQRLGGSIGTALLAVTLQDAVTRRVPLRPGVAGLHGAAVFGTLPPATRAQLAPALGHAFGAAFWFAFALTAVAIVPAVLLPRVRRAPQSGAAPGSGSAPGAEPVRLGWRPQLRRG